MQEPLRLGIAGLGTVGASVARLLERHGDALASQLGRRVEVVAVCARERERQRGFVMGGIAWHDDPVSLARSDSIDVFIELIGGAGGTALESVNAALQTGKGVVTANKALLARHGAEIFAAAAAKGVDVYFEAAVCGGVPIVRALREGLVSDRVEQFWGIVNGTSNFILTALAGGGSYAETLREAQKQGYAEADPTLDVSGGDAAHKLAILALLCFGTHVSVDDMCVEGITSLAPIDFELARRYGYVIKPLVHGKDHGTSLELRVHPTMVPATWLLAAVDGAKNALYVDSYALGGSMYYGAGAGMMPTAMAVVSDVIEVCRNIRAEATGRKPVRTEARLTARPVQPASEIRSRYYLRFAVLDRPGVLGQLTTILGEHEISIAQVLHEGARDPGRPVTVVVLTYQTREGNLRLALRQAAALTAVLEPAVVIRVAETP